MGLIFLYKQIIFFLKLCRQYKSTFSLTTAEVNLPEESEIRIFFFSKTFKSGGLILKTNNPKDTAKLWSRLVCSPEAALPPPPPHLALLG